MRKSIVAGGSTGRLAFFFVLGGGGGLGGVGVGVGEWGGRNNVPFAAFAWTFFLLPIFMLRFQAAASSCTQDVMLRLHAAASSVRNTSCYAFGRKCYVTLARCCIIFTQHVVLRFWSQVLCYACTLPHHLARKTSCYACTLLHHLYATRRATLLLGGVGGVGGGGVWGGWGGVGVGGGGWGGVITFLLLRSLGLFFLLPIFMLRLQAAASSLRNTACFPRKLEHKSLTESGRH